MSWGERKRNPTPTAGATPPLDPRIWAPAGSPEPFRSYTCIGCGRRHFTWESFVAHRVESRKNPCQARPGVMGEEKIARIFSGEEEAAA